MKKTVLLLFFMSILFVGCEMISADYDVPVSSITLSSRNMVLLPGQDTVIHATVLPSNATNPSLVWSTDDSTKAVVTEGRVHALSIGDCYITALSTDGSKVQSRCLVTIARR